MNRIPLSLLLLCLSVSLVGCASGRRTSNGPGFDITKIQVGPGNTISWEDAKAIIQYGDVDHVMQTHALAVYITMQDDTRYSTTEPAIDAVIRWVETVGKRDQIGIMSE